MKYIMTKIPIVEDALVSAFGAYLKELRFGEMYPYHKGVNISNDHPFEKLLDNQDGVSHLFPSITIVSSNDNESSGMAKGWQATTLERGNLDGIDPKEWYLAKSALSQLQGSLDEKGFLYGLQHSTVWRDSTTFEIWTENIQVKNDIYNLVMAFLTGPKVLELHTQYGFVIHSNTIQGQRSGYYNYDFGRVLYGGRVTLAVEYNVLQAAYDTDVSSLAELEHSYREVLHG